MTRSDVDRTDRASDTAFSHVDSVAQWENVPVEGSGYVSSRKMLDMPDAEILRMAALAEQIRYSTDPGERNEGNRWRRFLHEPLAGKRVLDFGCGFGLESLSLARLGCRVTLVDICEPNVLIARRLLALRGFEGQINGAIVADDESPYILGGDVPVDVFLANGVLHHVPHPREILLRARELLAEGGEVRLMVYTDKAWQSATGEPAPPVDDDTAKNPLMPKFRCAFDSVGYWADWYSRERLEHRFGDIFEVTMFEPLMSSGVYAAATLKPR